MSTYHELMNTCMNEVSSEVGGGEWVAVCRTLMLSKENNIKKEEFVYF